MRFLELFNKFISHCRYEKGLSPNTIKFYKIDLFQFHKFIESIELNFTINNINKEIIKLYLQSISEFKPKTIRRKIATLKAMFNHLEFEDLILINPFRKVKIKIKESKCLPKAMTIEEVQKIISSVYQFDQDNNVFKNKMNLRDIAILELLFATGLRVSELANLKSDQIDLATGSIILKGKGDKERYIQVCNKEALSAMRFYSKIFQLKIIEAQGHFFVNRHFKQLSTQSVRGIVTKYSKIANIKKHITPHMFRHTFATLLLENDVDIKYIQSFLGHSSIATTQIYTQMNQQKQRQILAKKHPRHGFSMKKE